MIHFSDLSKITGGKIEQLPSDREIKWLVIDSRKVLPTDDSVFFAINGARHDGHHFISELYQSGIRQFVVETPQNYSAFPEASFIRVESSLRALQSVVSYHRSQFTIPVIGITGSNGKTIVKEWLYQLLSPDYSIAKNPGSYNSQLGVPLSVWQLQPFHQLGIFEAGISKPGEMALLREIIQPTIGIFTNIGTAHDEGFSSTREKIQEKLALFTSVDKLIFRSDHALLASEINQAKIKSLSWAFSAEADIPVKFSNGEIILQYNGSLIRLIAPFADQASLENCIHCVVMMLHLNYDQETIQKRIAQVKSVPMRLELKPGINGCQLIDDSYNNDLGGLKISLDFLLGQQRKKKTLILSDIFQSGLSESDLVAQLSSLIVGKGITRFVGIGPFLFRNRETFKTLASEVKFYYTTKDFVNTFNFHELDHELILIKGARIFQFEELVSKLQSKVHGTVMEIDLNKIVHNLNFFRSKLKPGVKLMVMVKAFAYGSGSEEIANLLQYHKVDYLGVAYTDEGVDLRKNQISLPIMVMNPSPESFDALLNYRLEPVMYNLTMLRTWIDFLNGKAASVHVELDTGMHRLGFDEEDLAELISIFSQNKNVNVVSVFSHLAGADEDEHDHFTKQQVEIFHACYERITSALRIKPLRHMLNSPGLIRHSKHQMDMVRLGIGLYGINPTLDAVSELKPVASLKTIISQIKKIKKGETIGYGRKGKANEDIVLATIAIGYADGFSRAFSRGKGIVWVKGKRAPVVGNVCMDMTMIDVTGIDAAEGDEVMIFGDHLPIQEIASRIETIPYEILTSTSERVKRVFFADSI